MFQIIVMNKKISKGQSFDPQILVSLWESAFLTKGALPHFFLSICMCIDLFAFLVFHFTLFIFITLELR